MIPYLNIKFAKCIHCGLAFEYDAITKNAPWVCPACKVIKKQQGRQKQYAQRKQQAKDIGLNSEDMGRDLLSLTVKTHAQVGQILGITAGASRVIERRALAKIRKAFKLELLAKQIDNSLRNET